MPTTEHSPLPRVSIVIVSWNALHHLQRFLPDVVATEYPELEVILADNASSDGSAEWVAAHHPEVKIVRHPENWAFCRGNNEAMKRSSGEYVLLLNNDVQVTPGWLTPLVEAMERDRSLGAVQPKLLQLDDPTRFEYAGAAGGMLDRYGYPFARGRIFFTVEEDRGQYDEPAEIFWATGAAVLLRREVLDEIGLLDEHFHLHMEEIDLCWRMQRAGYRVGYVPESVLHHLGGGTLPQGDVQKVYYNFRNSILMLHKNLPPGRFRRVMPVRVFLDLAAALRALVIGRPAESINIFRAYRDGIRLLKRYRNSDDVAAERTVTPNYDGSIVWDYFIRGRRQFGDLPADRFRSNVGLQAARQASAEDG